jgi:hypothetical protein
VPLQISAVESPLLMNVPTPGGMTADGGAANARKSKQQSTGQVGVSRSTLIDMFKRTEDLPRASGNTVIGTISG